MSRAGDWIRPEVQALSAYHVPGVGHVVKLDAMENPYTWPDEDIRAEWAACLARTGVNRYPDPRATAVAARLREHTAVPADQALLLGNGSDELIQLVTLALARPGAKVLAPEPTFVMYRMIATFCGLEFVGVPLTADFGLDMPALEAAIEEHDPAVVWLAWPNNPTGNAWPRADVLRVADIARGLVVVDEAYHPFAQDSFISELGERDNLLVLRTLSKLGLAGLRLGFLAGPPAWLGEIDKLRLPYNVNALTQAGAAFALDHFERLERQAVEIRRERDALAMKLATLPGVKVYPSAANFVLLRAPQGLARTLFEGLLAEGILIKSLDGTHPSLTDCLRVTVGTPPENALLAEALQRRLSEVA